MTNRTHHFNLDQIADAALHAAADIDSDESASPLELATIALAICARFAPDARLQLTARIAFAMHLSPTAILRSYLDSLDN